MAGINHLLADSHCLLVVTIHWGCVPRLCELRLEPAFAARCARSRDSELHASVPLLVWIVGLPPRPKGKASIRTALHLIRPSDAPEGVPAMHRFSPAAALFVVGSLFAVSGCQFSYPFEINGVVQASDGTPLTGVSVKIKPDLGIRESTFPVLTGTDGRFRASIQVADREFRHSPLPKWTLEFTKAGYDPATVTISPSATPASKHTTTVISTSATLNAR